MKTDNLTKAIYVACILIGVYIFYELFFGAKDGWELEQFLTVGGFILLVVGVAYFGNKISRKG